MTTLEQAAQQALDALEPIHHGNMTPMAENAWKTAITALREALSGVQALSAAPAEVMKWPKDASEVREFMHTHCITEQYAVGIESPSDDDKYLLSAHDFLSAVNWWADFPHYQEASPTPTALSAAPAGLVDAARMAVEVLDWLPTSDQTNALWQRQQPVLEALRAALAASPTPPAEQQAEGSCVKLLAECRDAFPIPEPGSPLEVQWAAAMARPEEVPEYVRLCVAEMQATHKAAPGDEGKALAALRYYMHECSGAEPSISVFHRMVEEALEAAPQQGAQEPVAFIHWPVSGPPRLVWYSQKALNSAILKTHEDGYKPDVKLYAAPQPAPAPLSDPRIAAIEQAIRDYHYALDCRKHGGVAEAEAFGAICNAMKMDWVQGQESERRAAIAAQGDTP